MAATNRTPIVPTRVDRAASLPMESETSRLPVLIRISNLNSPVAPREEKAGLSETLAKALTAHTPSASRLKGTIAKVSFASSQFLLRHPRAVAATTLAAALMLAALLLLRERSSGVTEPEQFVAAASRPSRPTAPSAAEAPPWAGPGMAVSAPTAASSGEFSGELSQSMPVTEYPSAPPQAMISNVRTQPPVLSDPTGVPSTSWTDAAPWAARPPEHVAQLPYTGDRIPPPPRRFNPPRDSGVPNVTTGFGDPRFAQPGNTGPMGIQR